MASITMKKITVDVPTAGTAVPISATQIFTNQIEVLVPSTNTGSMYLGDSTVDSTWIPIAKNEVKYYTASESQTMMKGDYFDLSKLYVDAGTNGDDLVVQYYAREE